MSIVELSLLVIDKVLLEAVILLVGFSLTIDIVVRGWFSCELLEDLVYRVYKAIVAT